jgi:xanthine dehydrogenase molybdopterin-binding subunit B
MAQVEGAFVMGLGEFLTEQVVFSPDGQLLSVGTFEYKPPFPLDIPQTMVVRGKRGTSRIFYLCGSARAVICGMPCYIPGSVCEA